MGFLVNDGDKLTKELRAIKAAEAEKKYGLTKEELEAIKLPPKTEVTCYTVAGIVKAKSKLNVLEKINLLKKLEDALIKKLEACREKKQQKHVSAHDAAVQINPEEVPRISSNIDEGLVQAEMVNESSDAPNEVN